MNSYERVLRAWKIKDGMPDRVPIQFDLCRQLQDHFADKLGLPSNYTRNLYEDVTYRISGNEVRLAMGSDVVITGASEREDFTPHRFPDGTWLNEYNMRMKQGDIYVEVVEYPLAQITTKADVDEYTWPDPLEKSRYRDAEYYVGKYKNEYLIIGDIEVTILSLAQQLVGMEKLLLDMAMDEEYVEYLFEKCMKFQTKIGLELIRRGVDAIWLGDDFGSQTSLLFSPDMFRRMLKPYYAKMLATFKKENPNIITILHCDGAVKALLPDIKEMGIEVFNPVQPGVPGHSPEEIKDEFGDQLVFWGAIDQQYLLPTGTDAAVEEDIKHKTTILGKNGGYMIAPAHILQPDVSPERVEFFIETCRKYGKYE
ncbi:MAG: uroporphyrinogen decarboxylase family protein [Eubacteriales bacterium]